MRRRQLALVALGGAAGALLRFEVIERSTVARGDFPITTLVINLVGAFLLGVLVEVVERAGDGTWLRALLGVGLLGALTTFSGFAVETVLMVDAGNTFGAAWYVAATLVGGLAAVTTGLVVAGWRGGVPVPEEGES